MLLWDCPPPNASTSPRSQRKLRAEKKAPVRKPKPHCQPRRAQMANVPRAAITTMNGSMRQEARSKVSSSRGVIVRVFHDLANQLYEPGHAAENQKDDGEPSGTEGLVEVVPDYVSH